MAIELFRGLAALMVMMTHYAAYLPGAPAGLGYLWTGVDFFFVISGFVFAPMLLDSVRGNPGGGVDSLLPFWLRRLFRIYPLYVLALVAYALAMPADDEKGYYFLRHLAFLHTTRSFEEAYYFNPAFWSLPVEMEYYLLLPLLAMLRGRIRALALVAAVSLGISLLARYLRGPEDAWRILSVHLPSLLAEFMLGTGLAWMVARGRSLDWRWHSRPSLIASGCGLVLLVFTYLVKFGDIGLADNRWFDAPWNFLSAAAYALLMLPALLTSELRWPLWLRTTALYAGAASYGVYVFHNLTPRLLGMAGVRTEGTGFVLLAMVLSVVLALVLYRIFEDPLRRYGRRLAGRVDGTAPLVKREAG